MLRNMTIMPSGATHLMRKRTAGYMRLFSLRLPLPVNSSRTVCGFIFQPTKRVKNRPPMAIR